MPDVPVVDADGKTPRERQLEEAIVAAGFEVIDGDFVRRNGRRACVALRPVHVGKMIDNAKRAHEHR